MARSARSSKRKDASKPRAMVVDERPIERILPHIHERGNTDHAIRTILYIEVQDHPAMEAASIIQKITSTLSNEHPTFVIPLRFGKLTTEYEFEGEFLETAKALCEVKDGKIVLKDGAKKVNVIRQRI